MTALLTHEAVFERVALLLPAVLRLRLLGILRALDGAFRSILQKRGDRAELAVGSVVHRAAKSSVVRAGKSAWSAKA